ncbi:MAG: sigma-70 family RNA polymerase sigma factor [Bdellovibrionia bacterium]
MVIREDEKIYLVRVLFERYESKLLRYTMRFIPEQTARDVVQDAFLKLWTIDNSLTEDHVVQWLYTVCRNRAIDILRRDKRMTPLDHSDETVMASGEDVAADYETQARVELARSFMKMLGEKEREVIRLKFQDGLSYAQISAITGHSVSHVGVLIHNALVHLRQKMNRVENVTPLRGTP